jgi:predicted enzyme related to lactoylglutathione lyase
MRGSHGKFYWNELMARDVDGAKEFYADTMGCRRLDALYRGR